MQFGQVLAWSTVNGTWLFPVWLEGKSSRRSEDDVEVYSQGIGDALHDLKRRVTDAPLNSAHVGAVHLGAIRYFLLAEAEQSPVLLNGGAEILGEIHG
jgi:hypothetical protein